MRISPDSIKRSASLWLRQGISPRRLAFTLSLGFAIGCIPVVGITTVLCAALALALGLNLAVIQAANYAAMPAQLLLIVPFVRMGGWLHSSGSRQAFSASALLHPSPVNLAAQFASLALQALLAWLLVATPTVALMTLTLTPVLRKIPAVAAAEIAD